MTPTAPIPSAEAGRQAATLLLFSLGPVQAFIAAGRRTADLWAGSLLLSNLAKTALEVVAEQLEIEAVLFPALDDDREEGRAAYPNRFLAWVPVGTDPTTLANAAVDALRAHLREAAQFALEQVGFDKSYAAGAAERAAAFVEVYWAALPEDADAVANVYRDVLADPYGHLYRVVEGLAGSRKSLRDFDGRRESGYRCTLMPDHPALVPDDDPTPGEVRVWWEKIAARSGGRLRAGEHLSAIALTKRFYPVFLNLADKAFPSTSSFATADFVRAVLDEAPTVPALLKAATEYEAKAKALPSEVRVTEAALPGLEKNRPESVRLLHRLSGRLLIGDDLTVEEIERDTGRAFDAQERAALEGKLKELAHARARLFTEAGRAEIRPPSRYYALLVLDGDRMGQWLSGTYGKEAFPSMSGSERHRAISSALNTFALTDVPQIVEEQIVEGKATLGRLVYGGGDDVVALLSFETALFAAKMISEAFGRALDGGTVSAGLVFAHHLTPLQQVLDAARASEKRAKAAGRDRLCLTALKRSGAPEEAIVPWCQLDPVDLFAEHIRRGDVAKGLLYDLTDLRRRLTDREGRLPDAMQEPLRAEAARLFGCRTEGLEKAARRPFYEKSLGRMLHDVETKPDESERAPDAFDAAMRRLAVAQFLGRGGDR